MSRAAMRQMRMGGGRVDDYRFAIGGALFVVAFVVFLLSPVLQLSDSKYSMLTADALLHHHSFDLSRYSIPNFNPARGFGYVGDGNAYQLGVYNGEVLYGYPLGTSILSAPAVALADLLGTSPATSDGHFSLKGEMIVQKFLAAFLMALLAVILFRVALVRLGIGASLILAAGAAFGTQIWSTASRAMWSQTWDILLTGVVVWMLVAGEARDSNRSERSRPILLATVLALMFLVRPTAAASIAAVSVYMIVRRRCEFLPYAISGGVWAILMLCFWRTVYGTFAGFYYVPHQTAPSLLLHGLRCNLISPSRGIFIFCPALIVVLYLMARHWRRLPNRDLAITALGAIACLAVIVSAWPVYWAGRCFGPRFFTEAVPWFFLLAVLGCDAAISSLPRQRWHPAFAAGIVLLGLSIAINATGALSWKTDDWNDIEPLQVRVFDWSQPQFLAPWIPPH